MAKKSSYTFRQCFKDYWGFLEGKRLAFFFWLAIKALTDYSPFLLAFLLGMIVDFFTQYSPGDPLTKFYYLVGIIGFVGAFQVWLRFHAKLKMFMIAAKVRQKSRVLAITRLIDLELKWHEKEETGSKIQKINMGENTFTLELEIL